MARWVAQRRCPSSAIWLSHHDVIMAESIASKSALQNHDGLRRCWYRRGASFNSLIDDEVEYRAPGHDCRGVSPHRFEIPPSFRIYRRAQRNDETQDTARVFVVLGGITSTCALKRARLIIFICVLARNSPSICTEGPRTRIESLHFRRSPFPSTSDP